MVEIERRKAIRLNVMKIIFEESGGVEANLISGLTLQNKLEFSDQEIMEACSFLASEGLITCIKSLSAELPRTTVGITHKGVVEIEQSLQSPSESTEHFPPIISIVNVQGNVTGSAILSGSPQAQQEVSVGDIEVTAIQNFIRELEARMPALGLPETESLELTAEIATVKAQIDSPRPKRNIIRESLHTIRSVVEGIAGNVAAAPLVQLIQHIHL